MDLRNIAVVEREMYNGGRLRDCRAAKAVGKISVKRTITIKSTKDKKYGE